MSLQTSIDQYYKSIGHSQKQWITPDEKHPVECNLKNRRSGRRAQTRLTKSPNTANRTDLNVKLSVLCDIDRNTRKQDNSELNDSLEGSSQAVKQNRKRLTSGLKSSRSLSSPRKKQNGNLSVVKHLGHRTPKKLFRDETIDTNVVLLMIEYLNVSRLGILPKNNFDLKTLYSGRDFDAEDIKWDWQQINCIYNASKVNIPSERHAAILFNIITEVFSNPYNCGYFDNQELDQIFTILTLSKEALSLFARLIQRKYCWRTISSIEYSQISANLRPYFDELINHGLLNTDTEDESFETLLRMLSAIKVYSICRQFHIQRPTNKEIAINLLLKHSSIKPLFPGMESPAVALRKAVLNSLQLCVCLPKAVIDLIDRIVLLFIPSEEVTSKLSEIFLKVTLIKEGTIRYPDIPVQNYPVFANRDELVRYVGRRQILQEALNMTKADPGNWKKFISIVRESHCRLMSLLRHNPTRQQDMGVPRHVQKFREEYLCIKIINACFDVFKKNAIAEAVDVLKNLIAQESYLQSKKAHWYEELALIENTYNKDPQAAALTTIKGLTLDNITESGKQMLINRAVTLAVRRSGITSDTKSILKNLIDKNYLNQPRTVPIQGNMITSNEPGKKSTWSLSGGDGDKEYMTVEQRALRDYKDLGYIGWHCEGSLPLTLFTLLMWEELYDIPIPGAYLSPYQKAPLDLFTSEFYTKRKEHIDQKIQEIEALTATELGIKIKAYFEDKKHYETLMPMTIALTGQQLRELVQYMGPKVVSGICKRLAANFSEWRAGFPDLVVWGNVEPKYKLVEVKGPKDKLSPKQILWLRYLEELGAATEVCKVEASCKRQML